MKILQINTDNASGGAGRAASRLHSGLKQLGNVSRMIVRTKSGLDDNIQTIPRTSIIGRGIEYLLKHYYHYGSFHYLYYPSMRVFLKHPWVLDADVINLHNIHGNYFAYPCLPKLTHKKPVVWTLHDMWGFTGHCSYSFTCQRWKTGCGSCPDLEVYPQIRIDTTHLQWRIKSILYQRSILTIVTPSEWLLSLTRISPLLGSFQVRCIPNSVNTEIFRPLDRMSVRKAFDLPTDTFLLFYVSGKLQDKRKGNDLFISCMQKLASELPSINLAVVTVGEGTELWKEHIPFPVYPLGSISNDNILAACYSSVDLLVLTTRMDNLPNTLLESMACGTPCVSFNVGGVSEAVNHLETGYLAQAEAIDDLTIGITSFLHNNDLLEKCRLNSRLKAIQEFAIHIQAERYLELYQSIVNIK